MANELPSYFPRVSVCIDEEFYLLGYSQSDREQKIKFNIVGGVLSNILTSSVSFYLFGSRSDGSTMPILRSDYDSLHQWNPYKAVTNVSECVRRKVNLLMEQDDDTHRGHVKLQYVDLTRPHHHVPVRKCFYKHSVLDGAHRALFRGAHLKQSLERAVIRAHTNGPAITNILDGSVRSDDKVPAIRCYRWPAEGECFFTRRRCHSWPTAEQLQHIRDYGCFLVPIGHPSSSEEHLEWRLCFTIGERDLSRSFNDTMMKVFILLKIIKKNFIKPVIGDSFTSYHCKVCIFWVREKPCEAIWRRENILLCLSACLEQLLNWAKSGYYPDFFDARNNIYDRKIVGNVRLELVRILETMVYNRFEYLLCVQLGNISNLLSFRITFGYLQPIHRPTTDIAYEDYISLCSSYTCLHRNIPNSQQKVQIFFFHWNLEAVSSAVMKCSTYYKGRSQLRITGNVRKSYLSASLIIYGRKILYEHPTAMYCNL